MLVELSAEESSELPPLYQEVVCNIKEKREADMGRGDTKLWTEILFDDSKKLPGDDQDDFEISEEEDLGAGAMPPPSPSPLNDNVNEFYDDATVIGDTEDTLMPNSSRTASMELEEGSFVQSKDAGTTRRELDAKLEKLKRNKAKIEEEIEAIEAIVKKRAKRV